MEVTPIIKAGTFLFNFKTFPEIGYKCPGTPDFFFKLKLTWLGDGFYSRNDLRVRRPFGKGIKCMC